LTAAAGAATFERTYQIDTSSVAGVPGLVFLQFNPGAADSDPAVAAVENFNGFGATLGAPLYTGDAAGELEVAVILNNTEPLNQVEQPITFGSKFFFRLALEWPDSPMGSAGSTFGLFFVSLADTDPIFVLTDDPTGAAMLVDLLPDGTVLEYLGPYAAAVPEPGTAWLLIGAAGCIWFGRRRLTELRSGVRKG
jgi:hypothetical protein